MGYMQIKDRNVTILKKRKELTMEIHIKYCSVWNYQPRAAGLADAIEQETGIVPTLEPGSGGVYDISADGVLLYSKHQTGCFPDNREILVKIRQFKEERE